MAGIRGCSRPWLIALLLAAVLAAYGNALGGAFQFDDYRVIVLNPSVQTLAAWWTDMPGIRPLLKLSYTLNQISGASLAGFHLLNITIHAINGLLVFSLVQRLVERVKPGTNNTSLPLLAALVFSLHPINTEAVTYLSGRSSSMMSLFYLASLLAYDRSRQSGKVWLPVSVLCFMLALASKETAATLPFSLLLWDAIAPRPGHQPKTLLLRQSGHWGVLLLALAVFLAAPTYRWLFEVSARLRAPGDNLITHIHAVAYLAGQWWLPVRLNADPLLPALHHWSLASVLEAGILATALAWGLHNLHRYPLAAFAVLWLLLQLLPLHLLMPRLDPANERQLYLGAIGFAILAAIGLLRLVSAWRPPYALGALILVPASLALATHIRNHVYYSEIAFWEDVVRKTPHNARAFNNLGYAYRNAERSEEAENAYRRALALNPRHLQARFNLLALQYRREEGTVKNRQP